MQELKAPIMHVWLDSSLTTMPKLSSLITWASRWHTCFSSWVSSFALGPVATRDGPL